MVIEKSTSDYCTLRGDPRNFGTMYEMKEFQKPKLKIIAVLNTSIYS